MIEEYITIQLCLLTLILILMLFTIVMNLWLILGNCFLSKVGSHLICNQNLGANKTDRHRNQHPH